MKKKNMMIGIIILAVGLVIVGAILLITSKSNDFDDKQNNKTYDSLLDLANEMYENDSYLELTKNTSGAYYMTIGEYKSRGYNLDLVDSTCPDTFGIIYFDIENKDRYNKNPIYIVKSCREDSESYTSLLDLANELYKDDNYFDLPKDEAGGYYMTIGEYKSRGYNVDLVDSTCSEDSKLIYFDVENKDKYDYAPVFILDFCE